MLRAKPKKYRCNNCGREQYTDHFCYGCKVKDFTHIGVDKGTSLLPPLKKHVILHDNMLNLDEYELFQAEIPYKVENDCIENEDGLKVHLSKIWVDYTVKRY